MVNGKAMMPHHISQKKFEASDYGWYYDASKRAILIRFPNQKGNIQLLASWAIANILGM